MPGPSPVRRAGVLILLVALLLVGGPLVGAPAFAQEAGATAAQADTSGSSLGGLPQVDLTPSEDGYELPIQLLLLLTVLTLAPAIIILMTSFTRLVVVFSILRRALGLQRSPPRQVVIGLSLFLSLFIMQPVLETVHQDALRPYLDNEITQQEAFDRASTPMKRFMLTHTRDKDLMLFMDMGEIESFKGPDEAPLYVVVPAFVISELRIAFQIGFMIFLPFLVVDLVVASILMSMGMMMLPPVMISLPIKLLLFVLTDGWYLIVESLMQGYAVG
ncbi:flagellar type III secretion system pore protein FliP [Salinibacter ruber]|uniref:flagellar type III secretion system pore protein FliP n=1 Tax=Salinibacter ruber TaxID=146919 RepID=UPI002342ECBA|nr:flagellar type III secretion system pore protein FliP [Salinibacter ruber]